MPNVNFALTRASYLYVSALVLSFSVLFSLTCEAQQQHYSQSTSSLVDVVSATAKDVLNSCQSWPPKVAGNSSDQKSGKNLKDATSLIVTQLTQNLFGADSQQQPYSYGASFLRLVDSVGTTDPVTPDANLLDLAQLADTRALNLWGSNLIVMSQDCTSLLGLAAQADASVAIPLASLDAAFKASTTKGADTTALITMGSFQSPFDVFYNSPDSTRQTLAALKAINWGHKPVQMR